MRSSVLSLSRNPKAANRAANTTSQSDAAPPRHFGFMDVVRWLFTHLLNYRVLCGWVLLALILQIGYEPVFALIVKTSVDDIVNRVNAAAQIPKLVWLALSFFISAIASITLDYLQSRLVNQFSNDLRFTMFAHLQHLSLGYYANTKTGDLLSHFAADLDAIEKAAPRFIEGIGSLLALLVGGSILFYLEWRLALTAVVLLPLITLGSRLFAGRASTASFHLQKEKAAMMSMVQENILAQRVIKAFGLQPTVIDQMASQLTKLVAVGGRADFLSSLVGTSSTLCVQLTQLVVMSFAIYLAFNGSITTGTFVSVKFMLDFLSKNAYDLAKKLAPTLIKAGGGVLRIETLLNTRPRVVDETQAAALPRFERRIRFENVAFGYNSQSPILKQLCLTIPAGKTVAFVGPSGAGKSTILNLLLRFYDASSGRITIDGHDLRRLTTESLREQIGVVFQDTFLFNTSIRENIRLSKLDATDADVERAAKAAELHDTIMSWPKGYETNTGEMGGQLSGGQRQRIALARAMLRDPAILVLDEATSALDPTTEAAILATLERLGKNRTVIWVTHHLSSVENVDQIYVMESGRLVEQGRHAELLARRGVYASMWQTQSGQELPPIDENLKPPSPEEDRVNPFKLPIEEQPALNAPSVSTGRYAHILEQREQAMGTPGFDLEEEDVTYRLAEDVPQPLLGYFVRITNNPSLPSELPIYGMQPAPGETRQIHIGRHSKHNTVIINDRTVSREHAVLVQKDGRVYLRDNASTGGTLINWRRLKPGEELLLRHNDVVGFGEVVYEFKAQSTSEAAAAEQ